MKVAAAPGLLGAVLLAAGCGTSVDNPTGLEEPIRVTYPTPNGRVPARFFAGEIPFADGPGTGGILTRSNTWAQGTVGIKFGQFNLKKPAAAGVLRLHGLGSGYWTWPVELEDVLTGEFTSSPGFDLSP